MLGCGNIEDAVDDTILFQQALTIKEMQIVVDVGDALEVIPEEREKSTDENSICEKEATVLSADDEREGAEGVELVKDDVSVLGMVSLEEAPNTKEVEMLLEGADATTDAASEITEHTEMKDHILSVVKLPNELDFDDSPTELFLSLQRKDWDASLARARNFPEETCIWISRKEDDGERIRWRLLPLHAAVIFGAPANVVALVLECFPLGARARDDQGMLPLHLVFRQGGMQEIVQMLLQSFPDGVDVENSKGRTPMDIAKSSSSPQRDSYVEALSSPPPTLAEVAGVLDKQRALFEAELAKASTEHHTSITEQHTNITEQRTAFESKIEEMRKSHQEEIISYQADADEIQSKLLVSITTLEDDMLKTQENSQILVDHVANLEAQLESRSETERFLATRISNLHAFLKDTSKSKEDVEVRLKQEIAQLLEEKLVLQKTVSILHEEKSKASTLFIEAQSKLNDLESSLAEALKAKHEASSKLKEEMAQVLEEKLTTQETVAALQAEKADLSLSLHRTKAQLKEIEDVQNSGGGQTALKEELAKVREEKKNLQVEMLTVDESARYKRLQGECDALRIESGKVKAELEKRLEKEQALSSRVSTLALQLADNMQDTNAEKSTYATKTRNLEREREELRDTVSKLSKKLITVGGFFEKMTKGQQAIVEQVAAQERELALSASDQGKIFSLLKDQEEFFNKIQEDRKFLAVAAKRHVTAFVQRSNTTKRGELVRTVTLLKHQMLGAMDTTLAGIPQEVSDVDNVLRTVKTAPTSAWSNTIYVDSEMLEAEVESALEADVVAPFEEEEEVTFSAYSYDESEQRKVEPVVEKKVAAPIVEKVADAVVEKQVAEAVVEKQVAEPIVEAVVEKQVAKAVVEKQVAEVVLQGTMLTVEEDIVTAPIRALAPKIQEDIAAFFTEEEKKDDGDAEIDPGYVSVMAKIAMLEQRRNA